MHNVFRHSATAFYGFDKLMGWTEEDKVAMWKGVDIEAWEGRIGSNDVKREEVMGGEEHWFLAPVMVWLAFLSLFLLLVKRHWEVTDKVGTGAAGVSGEGRGEQVDELGD